ncbi:ABC transporter ATP-binding protein [Wolinella succinogenes]|uniref:ABC transporter ATP-binding protein n=1 Tax=Wolinella succinogenes TaxID=844 RepID=UPI0016BBDA76|nr:ABC transporter ATP-binding protein [Wolinella succinogenes]NLU34494.1 ABC transporter ATP-binding protein [Wolinella succinogenes]
MNSQEKPSQGALWPIMAPVKVEIGVAIFLAALAALASIVGLSALALSIASLVHGAIEWEKVILAGGCMIASFTSRMFAFRISHLGAFKLEQILRTNLSTHLAQIPLGHIITLGSGSLKKVMLDDVKNLHAFVADSTPMIGRAAITPFASLIAMAIFDWRLACVSLGVLLLGGGVMYWVMRDSVEYRRSYEQNQGKINAAVIEFVQAMPVVRTFDDGSSSFGRYQNALEEYRRSLKEWIALTGTSARIGMMVLSPIPTLLAIASVGSWLYLQNDLEFGALIATLLLGTGMADAMMPLMWLSNFIKKSESAAHKIRDILRIAPLPSCPNPEIPRDSSVRFEGVSFSYEGRESLALKEVSFEVPEGSVCALVGPSGAGKSTAAKLIPRFWDVSEGRILLGGVDVREIEPSVLMDHVSFVFQDTFLFQDTLLNNILMAKPNATKEEAIEAAKAAQIHDFILTLPQGYETLAGDRGANLSGGQKQRITIARAILRHAPVVVLDEATAFADPENEEEIIKALAELMKGKTVIVIAHRLSTIKDVDQIIVFDQGRAIERGKHEELLEHKGLYAKLWGHYQQAQSWDIHHKEAQS